MPAPDSPCRRACTPPLPASRGACTDCRVYLGLCRGRQSPVGSWARYTRLRPTKPAIRSRSARRPPALPKPAIDPRGRLYRRCPCTFGRPEIAPRRSPNMSRCRPRQCTQTRPSDPQHNTRIRYNLSARSRPGTVPQYSLCRILARSSLGTTLRHMEHRSLHQRRRNAPLCSLLCRNCSCPRRRRIGQQNSRCTNLPLPSSTARLRKVPRRKCLCPRPIRSGQDHSRCTSLRLLLSTAPPRNCPCTS
eukprot:COSAG04_NODE_635_length_11712_cov_7.556187_8_plen_247_part_00